MPHYLRLVDGETPQLWRVDDAEKTAVHLGVSNPEGSAGSFFKAGDGETVWDAIARQTPWFLGGESPFRRLKLDAGHHHPRIARPIARARDAKIYSPSHLSERNMLASAQGQAAVLALELSRICRSVHPAEKNFEAFGHDIRNLLILAATEAEMHFRSVLAANGSKKKRPTICDYAVLGPVMKLDEYAVGFHRYPWLPAIRPFAAWAPGETAGRLGWYAAYNGVKHDREGEFEQANLRHAFEAVSACAVLLVAQFGRRNGIGFPPELSTFFHIEEEPCWPVEEAYSTHLAENGGEWVEVRHPALLVIQ